MNLSHAVGVVLAALFERRLAALGLEEVPVGQDVQGELLSMLLAPMITYDALYSTCDHL